MKLRELVALDHLRCSIVACEPSFEREIRWVYMTELADPSPYLRGGEVVITNGLWHDRISAEQFTAILDTSGVCGLGYGLGPVTDETPQDLVKACQTRGLPLFEVRHPTSFGAISEAFAARQAEERQTALLHAIRRNKAFVEAIAKGSGADGVLSVLSRDYGVLPSLYDHAGHLLAATMRPPSPDEAESVVAAIRERRRLPAVIALEDDEQGLLFPIEPGGTDAYLLCRKNDFSSEDRGAIAETVEFLKLEFAHRHAVQALEMRFATELVDLICAGSERRTETAARLRAFGLDPEGWLVVLAVRGPEALYDETSQDAVIAFFRARGLTAVAPQTGAETLVVTTWNGSQTELRITARELASGLSEGPHAPVAIGIGTLDRGTDHLRRSLLEARYGARLGIESGHITTVISHDEFASHRLLFGLQDEDLQAAFRRSLLQPLWQHDANHRGDLVHTLKTFLHTTGQWQLTADRLHIHVNTLRHRLRRVEELTGRSLARMDDRVDLYIALQDDFVSGRQPPGVFVSANSRGRNSVLPPAS